MSIFPIEHLLSSKVTQKGKQYGMEGVCGGAVSCNWVLIHAER